MLYPGLIYISSTYHEVTEYQTWFPFVKGLVGYNILLDGQSLIPKSLARHLKQCIQHTNSLACSVLLLCKCSLVPGSHVPPPVFDHLLYQFVYCK